MMAGGACAVSAAAGDDATLQVLARRRAPSQGRLAHVRASV
jgi:hypothetical protein